MGCCGLRSEEKKWLDLGDKEVRGVAVPSAEEEAMAALKRQQLEEAMKKAKLSPTEKDLIDMVYFDPAFKNQADARWEFGVLYRLDPNRVRAIEEKALRKFRRPAVVKDLRGF